MNIHSFCCWGYFLNKLKDQNKITWEWNLKADDTNLISCNSARIKSNRINGLVFWITHNNRWVIFYMPFMAGTLIFIEGGYVWKKLQHYWVSSVCSWSICRALLPRPKLILADEATGNLDPANKTRILDLLFQSVEDHDATLIAVTHDYELLERFDRVVDFKGFQE